MHHHWLMLCLGLVALVGSGLPRGNGEASGVPTPVHQGPVTGRLADGGTFRGWLTLAALTMDDRGQLSATGALTGRAHPALGRPTTIPAHAFTSLAAVLDLRGTCTTIVLDVQPIMVAALGQEITLTPLVFGPRGHTPKAHQLHTTLCALARLQEVPDETRPDDAQSDSGPGASW